MAALEIPALVRTPEEEPFELRPDPTEILTIPPDDPEPEYTEEQLEYKRKKDKAQRCKVIAMDTLDLDPMKNTYYSSKPEKFLIRKEVERLFEMPDEEIKAKFFEVCNRRILTFEDPKNDYTNFSVYKTIIPS
jgi:hypothetical protein